MGTNYYCDVEITVGPTKKITKNLHVGKSSGGWAFSLQAHPELGIETLDDWKELFAAGVITNEYGTVETAEEMIDIIINRRREHPIVMDARELAQNNAWIDTKYNLLRHKSSIIGDKNDVVNAEDGPYDVCYYEFF